MRIDPHVHFRDEGQSHKETIRHGLQLAREQGVDIVFDMPNTQSPILYRKDIDRRLSLVPSEERRRYMLYVGATEDEKQLEDALNSIRSVKEVVGMKMFAGKSTGNLQITSEEGQRKVYEALAGLGYKGVLAVHCEKEKHMTGTFDPKNPISHAESRPEIAETESIKDQIRFSEQSGFEGKVHVCHISCGNSVGIVEEARQRGIKITCGVTPHHLLWNENRLREQNGLLYKMNPPLRKQGDVGRLRQGLQDNLIDWIETDHAPHTVGEKLLKGFPSGYPSLYLYREILDRLPEWGISKRQEQDITFNNIIRTYNLDVS